MTRSLQTSTKAAQLTEPRFGCKTVTISLIPQW